MVLLDRSSDDPSLTPIDGDEAAGFFDEDEDETDAADTRPEDRLAVDAWLRRQPTWRLDAGESPHRAARLLETLVAARLPAVDRAGHAPAAAFVSPRISARSLDR